MGLAGPPCCLVDRPPTGLPLLVTLFWTVGSKNWLRKIAGPIIFRRQFAHEFFSFFEGVRSPATISFCFF